MSDALADVFRAFRAAGVPVSPEDVADGLWLSQWQPAAPDAPPEPVRPEPEPLRPTEPPDDPEETSTRKPADESHAPKVTTPPPGDTVGLSLPPTEGQRGGVSGRTFWAPAAPALARPRELARALRPLVRRVPSRVRFVLDEAETVRRFAEARVCDPALRPARERWLNLALVIDTGAGANLWKDTAHEFRGLLACLGAFRDARAWRLDTDTSPPRLLSGDRARAGEAARHPRELIDLAGRTLVVVLSPCVTPAWRDGSAARVLSLWAARGPVLLVPLLPEHMWPRTALGKGTLVRVTAPAPGAAGGQLRTDLPGAWPGEEPPAGVPVPVAVLEPASLYRWASLVAARPGAEAPALLLDTDPVAAPPARPVEPPNGAVRVERFWRTSSPLARRLAGLLAAAPVVNLPILRLVRQSMLPAAGQPHEAEVLFGGLLTPALGGGEPDPRFAFFAGAREALLDAAPTDESLAVLAAVSDYLGEHLVAGRTFKSVFADPSSAAGALVAADSPFAQVAAAVLARAGGDYARMVRREPVRPRATSPTESYQAPLRRVRPPEPEPEPAVESAAPVAPEPPFRRAAALVIGITSYTSFYAGEHRENDAKALASLLIDPAVCRFPSKSVTLLINEAASHDAIVMHLSRWLPSASRKADLVVLFFTGWVVASATGEVYLLPHDADPDQLSVRGVALSDLRRTLAALDTEAIVCLECYPGTGQFPDWYSDDIYLKAVRSLVTKRCFVIAGCEHARALRGSSRRHSLFTHHLLRGIEGAGDRNGDGKVGVFELFEYVSEAVLRDSRGSGYEQKPWFSADPTAEAYISAPRPRPDESAAAMSGAVEHEIAAVLEWPAPEAEREEPPAEADSPPASWPPELPDGNAELQHPHTFGRYELSALIRQTSVSRVYAALPADGGPKVALKIPRPSQMNNADVRERFSRERHALKLCAHPGIVPLLDAGEHDGLPYFTTPLVVGAVLGTEPLDPPVAARVVVALAGAMQHAHDHDLIHGNLKPNNIVVRPDGVPVVIDLGLALVRGAFDTVSVMGTPNYMAPEQFNIDRTSIGPRSDVYALGAILYELLTGAAPFAGENTIDVMRAATTTDPRQPSVSDPRLAPFDEICLKALAKNPDDRYESMAEFAAALTAVGAPAAPPDPASEQSNDADGPTRLSLPRPFGRYTLEYKIRSSTFYRVFAARDPARGQRVVVNMLRAKYADNERARAQLQNDYQINARLAALDLPCVPVTFESGEVEKTSFFATEFADGPPLDEYWAAEQKRLGLHGLADLIGRVATAFAEIASALAPDELIHGNLKPSKVLVAPGTGPEPRVLVQGFGLALILRSGERPASRTFAAVGTPQYMAPELSAPEWHRVPLTPRADVYALGVTLYKLLAGAFPFAGKTTAALRKAATEAPRPPSAFDRRFAPFDAVCLKALARDPGDRYGSMAEFAAVLTALARVLAPTTELPAVEPPPERPAEPKPAPADPFANLPCDFGRYRLLSLRQVDGMRRFTVFNARDNSRDQPVAVTVLQAGADPEQRRTFRAEIRIGSQLSELGLRSACRFLDAGTIDGSQYFVTESVSGQALDAYWSENRDRLGLDGLAALVARVALDMAAAHRAFAPGVLVHRNLSPRNVLVVPGAAEPRVVILGFGLALVRYADGSPDIGYTGGAVGAFGYMPPEQMAVGGVEVTPRSDVYSLGVILYQLLTGSLPYTGANSAELAAAMRERACAPPRAFDPSLVLFDPICERALAQNPDRRYASMDEFAHALTALVVSGAFSQPAAPPAPSAEPAVSLREVTLTTEPPKEPPPRPRTTVPMDASSRLEREDVGDITVIKFVDRKILDEQKIQTIGEALVALVDRSARRKVVVNFTRVEFMSSACLGKFLVLHRKLHAVNGKLVLCNLARDVLDPFKITKLDRILTIVKDEETSFQQF